MDVIALGNTSDQSSSNRNLKSISLKEAEISIVFDTFSSESVIKVDSKTGQEIHMAFPNGKELEKWF